MSRPNAWSSLPWIIQLRIPPTKIEQQSQGSNSNMKDKPEPRLREDPAPKKPLLDLISSGEVYRQAFETALLHRPQGLKQKG